MGARKGQNNFGEHQKRVVADNLRKVERVLKALPRGTRYADFNALKRAVANASGIDATTLRRNERYSRAIWAHVAGHPGLIAGAVGDAAPHAMLKVDATSARIEAAALRRKVDRLEKWIARQGSEQRAEGVPQVGHGGAGRPEAAFERTATVLARLLDRLAAKGFGIVLDLERGEIQDTIEDGPEAVIACRPDTAPFLDWMRNQGGDPNGRGEGN